MISVEEALDRLFALAPDLSTEQVPLHDALGRILAEDVVATRAQPPFDASAMDGYAVRQADLTLGQPLPVVGEARAGEGFHAVLPPGAAVRILTGAPVPDGADFIVIQEDVQRTGDLIHLTGTPPATDYIRPRAGDFDVGTRVTAPRRLRPADIALAASMNAAHLVVRRRPRVALIPTGDELVQPGEAPGPDQIVTSNILGLHALFAQEGAETSLLPIARDSVGSLRAALALADGADLVVTTGGASVGTHDLVADALGAEGSNLSFHKVAMRPGKPLMAAVRGKALMIGLPGNPVSAMICGLIFILPVLRKMRGLPAAPMPRDRATLGIDLPKNGPREHYMRARSTDGRVTPFENQDSSLLTVLADANALIVRPPQDPPRRAGDAVDIIHLTG